MKVSISEPSGRTRTTPPPCMVSFLPSVPCALTNPKSPMEMYIQPSIPSLMLFVEWSVPLLLRNFGLPILVMSGFGGPSAIPSLSASVYRDSCWVWIFPSCCVQWRTMRRLSMEMIPRGLSTSAKIVLLSAFPSWSVSVSLVMYPRFGFFPSDPCISTPTNTSP